MMSTVCFYSYPPPHRMCASTYPSTQELKILEKNEVCPAHKHTDCFYLVMIPKSTQCPNYSHSLSTVLGTADLTDMS